MYTSNNQLGGVEVMYKNGKLWIRGVKKYQVVIFVQEISMIDMISIVIIICYCYHYDIP